MTARAERDLDVAAPPLPFGEKPVGDKAKSGPWTFFVVNEQAYASLLGLVGWNDADRWYHGPVGAGPPRSDAAADISPPGRRDRPPAGDA
jgi:hypothetical protein